MTKNIRKGDTVEFRYGEKHLYGEIIKTEYIDEETGEEHYRIACGSEHPVIYRDIPRCDVFRVFHI